MGTSTFSGNLVIARARPLLGVVVALCVVGATPVKADVVTLVSQDRSVLVTTTGAPAILPAESLQEQAADFGPFNGSVSSQNFAQAVPGFLQTVTQNSILTVTANGLTIVDQSAFDGSISENPLPGQSDFDVKFTLSQEEPFTVEYAGVDGDARVVAEGKGTVVNGDFTGPGAPGLLAPANPSEYIPGQLLEFSGVLQPGAFEVTADLNGLANSGSIDLSVNIGPSVPLPPAVWGALLTLPLAGWALRRVGECRAH